jgi:hypothetical protein
VAACRLPCEISARPVVSIRRISIRPQRLQQYVSSYVWSRRVDIIISPTHANPLISVVPNSNDVLGEATGLERSQRNRRYVPQLAISSVAR